MPIARIEKMMAEYGNIVGITMKGGGRYAYIHYSTEQAAQRAVRQFRGGAGAARDRDALKVVASSLAAAFSPGYALRIDHLPGDTKWQEVKLFGEYEGKFVVDSARVFDHGNEKYALVYYAKEADMRAAVSVLNGATFGDAKVTAELEPRVWPTSTPQVRGRSRSRSPPNKHSLRLISRSRSRDRRRDRDRDRDHKTPDRRGQRSRSRSPSRSRQGRDQWRSAPPGQQISTYDRRDVRDVKLMVKER
jgi:hypothetical protein